FNASVCSFSMANNLFYFHYYWDSNLNKVLLSSFAIYHYSFLYFIHPDWEAFNKNLVKALDGDIVIDTVDTGTGTRNVFLSDFLSEVSFVINGQNTIEAARNSFTADKSRWKFQFDLSEYILDRDYDYLTDTYEYFGYDRYEETFELEFSKGGILSKMSTGTIYTITKENIRTSYETQLSMKVGDSTTATINFSVLPVIIVLILLPIILPFKRKKN
ncbi:MAG: hypothetical protein H7641_07545, partial [Candidatus Heimdallarchaeota archaeon]|nr:hypothetical protein [Candidatus Heimdallarchaeota archaeon]MCK4877417.1 hypothetical protein [Candidatus Heimdallarchaeota archaeon]